jgi:probable HAF family extracellular repeat protein
VSGYEALITTPTGTFSDGTEPLLGFLDGGSYSRAYGISDNGQVVGSAYISSFDQLAFYYWGNGPMMDLNTLIDPSLGWDLEAAFSINDAGQIAGYGVNSAGTIRLAWG